MVTTTEDEACDNWITIFFTQYRCLKPADHTDDRHYAVRKNGSPITWRTP